jgi:pyridoxal phosphate enzyme (YggS family)
MIQPKLRETLNNRLAALEERIEAACRRAGRPRSEITLVAITKSVSASVAAILPELGIAHLGESRPQELWRKAPTLSKNVQWHLVGHLQRNKIVPTLPLVYLIHSVDSLRLLAALEQEASKRQLPVAVLLEVNTSGEPQKHGFTTDDVGSVVPELVALRHVHIRGLMTMAALVEDPERCRPSFAALRELRNRLSGDFEAPHLLHHLSMGMTNDFEVAIEEGATLIRIGTALLGGLSEQAV